MNLSMEFIKQVQRREANVSVSPSAARGMKRRTVEAACKFLCNLDITPFATDSEITFQRHLNESTLALQSQPPGINWGAARKFLNIFLRGAFYNRFLYEYYRLASLEPFLEVPLDSFVAKGLHKEEGGSSLPSWNTIVSLQKDTSDQYQGFARQVAQKEPYCCGRVHLDLWYWRSDQKHNHSRRSGSA